MDNIRQPSEEELRALVDFKSYFGGDWKDELAFLYYGGGSFDLHSHGQALKQVIKREGLDWLKKIEISEDGVVVLDQNQRPESVFKKLFSLGNEEGATSNFAFYITQGVNLDAIKDNGIVVKAKSTQESRMHSLDSVDGVTFHEPKSAALVGQMHSDQNVLLYAARIQDLLKCGDLVGEGVGMDWKTSQQEYGTFIVKGDVPAHVLIQIHTVEDLAQLVLSNRALDASSFVNQIDSASELRNGKLKP